MQIRDRIRVMMGLPPREGESVFDVLTREHREVDVLFAQMDKAVDFTARRVVFDRIHIALSAHVLAEQVVVYPLLGDNETTHQLVLEGFEEHRILRTLLDELAQGSVNDAWLARLDVLREAVTHHVHEEETELFPRGRVLFDAARQHEVAEYYIAAHLRLKRRREALGPALPVRPAASRPPRSSSPERRAPTRGRGSTAKRPK